MAESTPIEQLKSNFERKIVRTRGRTTRPAPPRLVVEFSDTTLRGASRDRSGNLQPAFAIPIDPTVGLLGCAEELQAQLKSRGATEYDRCPHRCKECCAACSRHRPR